MKKIISRFLSVIFTICFLAGMTVTVNAEVPYDSYTYWSDVSTNNKSVYNRAMYQVGKTLSAADIGVGEFGEIKSICTDEGDNVYILDSTSRIVVLDKEFKLIREIGPISGTERYDNAASVYVYTDGTLYICDKSGNRIIHATAEGELIEFITLPDSPLIPEDFTFNPVRIARDKHDYLYVLSEGSYYGMLLYGPDKEFLGFYGANTVGASISGVLTNIQNRIFPNNEKKANTAQKLPFSFVDIEIDNNDFIYTCNGYTSASDRVGQIRKLSPGVGKNILNSSDVNFVDENINSNYKSGSMAKQNIADIEVDSNGFIYGLESVYGKIFLYDSDCNILSVFGGGMGEGTQSGNFVNAAAMALLNNGNKLAVVDSKSSLITVFHITDFGRRVKECLYLTNEGLYDEAEPKWLEILKEDRNFQPAYAGLARVYLDKEDYGSALEYSKKGYDRDTYAVAFEYKRNAFIDDNFVILFSGIVLLIIVVIAGLIISRKRRLITIKNKEIGLMLSSPIHPVNTFTEIKEKHYGSVLLSVVLVLLYYVSTVLQSLAGGFLFTVYDPESFNSLFILIRSAGLVILWIVSNWMICTLMGGKGKLREIIIITCYSLIPIIVKNFIRLFLTNVLVPTEATFLGILDTIAILYFGIMLIIGLIKIHDFSMSRLVGTSALSVAGIAAIVFLMIMFVILVQQFWGFLLTVATEVISL